MGTRCAPNYAIIFMAEVEEEFLTLSTWKPRIWIRFIDDIFMAWQYNLNQLEDFIEELNNFHPTIKFTKEVSEFGLFFLDTFVYKEDRTLKTKVYHKPTDNKQYLLYTSCHPKQHKDAIPYGLLVRAKRICSKQEEFENEARSIINILRRRKYPETILRKAVVRIDSITRDELLKPKKVKEDNRIHYIITYNSRNPKMKDLVLQNIHLLARMRKNPINQEQIQTVYRKASHLRDLLITGLINTPEKQKYRCVPCKDSRRKSCLTCERINHTNTVTSSDQVTLKIRGNFNCQSTNAVYCLTCHCCGKKYIGETSQTINLRMRGHESNIRNWRKHERNPVAQHFGTRNLNEKQYSLEVLDQEIDKNKRNRLEKSWIFLINTITPPVSIPNGEN